MIISNLTFHNIKNLSLKIKHDLSYGIAGFSGSGKSSFCSVLSAESKKRLITLLPKNEYQFLFPDLITTNYGAFGLEQLPLVHYLRNHTVNLSPRSTIGTNTGIYRKIREKYAIENAKSSEFFSFNLPINWCSKCKGRGSYLRVVCSECDGTRYLRDILSYKLKTSIGNIDIVTVNNLPIEKIHKYAPEFGLELREQNIAENMIALGIGYLSLGRTIGTLSGGELTRLHLAETMASSSSILLIVDELSLGMDEDSLNGILSKLKMLGQSNQIWLIDHSKTVLESTQNKIFFGPGSGLDGGKVIDKLPTCEPHLPPKKTDYPKWIKFNNLSCRNIQIPILELPLGQLLIITGESGCGKSTLMRDCISAGFSHSHHNQRLIFIGQGRFQAVTSRSTIATFLDFNDILRGLRSGKNLRCHHCGGSGIQEDSLECNWCIGTGFDPDFYGSKLSDNVTVHDVLTRSISDIIHALPIEHISTKRLRFLVELGAGYLNLGRTVRSLSTGEFQRLHLAAKVGGSVLDKSTILLFDEPSRGLSQNVLNNFISSLRELINKFGISVWMIEHNKFLIQNADYVLDFGKRSNEPVTLLKAIKYLEWVDINQKPLDKNVSNTLTSSINIKTGINELNDSINRRKYFEDSKKIFQGGILKEFSPTARWFYNEIPAQKFQPVVAIDFEDDVLYSKSTFVFDLVDIANKIAFLSNAPEDEIRYFDYNDKEMHCKSCKGSGLISTFDFKHVLDDDEKNFGNGLLKKEIMDELKRYNFSKIRFMFNEIRKTTKFDLTKSLSKMNNDEKEILWYGLWDRSYYDSKKGKYYRWRGLIYLIKKYMRSSKSPLKEELNASTNVITCPTCKGDILFHRRKLSIREMDIRDWLCKEISELATKFPELSILKRLAEIVPEGTCANTDVSLLKRDIQVRLKLFEIAERSFYGYRFVFDNITPFLTEPNPYISKISKDNEIIFCDYPKITSLKKDIIDSFKSNGFNEMSYVWEVLGFELVRTEINRVKKVNLCIYCEGKGRFEVESPDDTIDIVSTTCSDCNGWGISPKGLEFKVQGIPIKTWLSGSVYDLRLDNSFPPELGNTKLMYRLKDVEKVALFSLLSFFEKRRKNIKPKKNNQPK